jgi:hypothetical protein
MTDDRWFRKDFEGSGCSVTEMLSQHLAGGYIQSRHFVYFPRKMYRLTLFQIPGHFLCFTTSCPRGLMMFVWKTKRRRLSFIHSSMTLQPLFGALVDFSVSESYIESVGLLGRGISPSQGHYLHTGQNTNKEYFFLLSGGGVRLSLLGTSATD